MPARAGSGARVPVRFYNVAGLVEVKAGAWAGCAASMAAGGQPMRARFGSMKVAAR